MSTQTISQKPATRTVPLVGMGASKLYPQDTYPMRIVKVSDTGHAIWVLPVRSVSTVTGHTPAGSCNGFPVWDHTYTDAELEALTETHVEPAKATRRGDGTYRLAGGQTQIGVGYARYFRNYAD
jgi:hypothetical protein